MCSTGDKLLALSIKLRALTYGDFILSSGQRSDYYFDGRRLTLDPEGAYTVATAFIGLLEKGKIQAIGGPTLGADPIVSTVSLLSYMKGIPIAAFIVRGSAKEHGTQNSIEGPLRKGSRVAIVDDTCTTGASLLRSIEAAEGVGCTVVKVMSILDRHQGGSQMLIERGYSFVSLLEATPDGTVRVSSTD